MSTPHILSVGGSLLFTGAEFNRGFLELLKAFVEERVSGGDRFVLIVGGGAPSRMYQAFLDAMGGSMEDRDWVGIHATRLNARLIAGILGEKADANIIMDPLSHDFSDRPVSIAGGWKPGWSTDYVSVVLAKRFGAARLANLTNTSHVFDKDPRIDPSARAIEDISWKEYRAVIPGTWYPGLHTPFDPRAAEEAEVLGLTVGVMGVDMENVGKFLDKEAFVGTLIHP